MKTCTKCGIEKDFGEFGKEKLGKDGLKSSCKMCLNSKTKIWKLKNKDKLLENDKLWRKENPDKVAYKRKKYNSSEKGKKSRLEFVRRLSKEIYPSYVKKCLIKQGFKKEDIEQNSELILLKTITIKTKRLCKTSQN